MIPKRLRHNFSWQLIANLAQVGFSGILMIYLGATLGLTEFGIYSLIMAITSVLGQCFEIRTQDIVASKMWFISSDSFTTMSEQNNKFFFDIFLYEFFGRLVPVLVIVSGLNFIMYFNSLQTEHARSLLISAFGFLGSKVGWGLSTGTLRLLGKTRVIAICSALDWGVRLLFAFILISFNQGSIGNIFLAFACVSTGVNVIQNTICYFSIKNLGFSFDFLKGWKIRSAFESFKSIKRILISNLGISLTDLMGKDLDITLAAPFASLSQIGLYKMAKNFSQVLWRFIDPVYLVVMPEIQILWREGKKEQVRDLIGYLIKRLFPISIVSVILLTVAVNLAEGTILPDHFKGIAPLTSYLSLWIIISAPLVWGHPLLIAIGRPELSFFGNLFASICGVALLNFLAPAWGIYGIGLGWFATLIIGFSTSAILAYKLSFTKRAFV